MRKKSCAACEAFALEEVEAHNYVGMHLFDQNSKPFSCICSTTRWFHWSTQCLLVAPRLAGFFSAMRIKSSKFKSVQFALTTSGTDHRTTESKNLIREFRQTFLSQRVLKQLANGSPSQLFCCQRPVVDNKEPSHLCALVASQIFVSRPS